MKLIIGNDIIPTWIPDMHYSDIEMYVLDALHDADIRVSSVCINLSLYETDYIVEDFYDISDIENNRDRIKQIIEDVVKYYL